MNRKILTTFSLKMKVDFIYIPSFPTLKFLIIYQSHPQSIPSPVLYLLKVLLSNTHTPRERIAMIATNLPLFFLIFGVASSQQLARLVPQLLDERTIRPSGGWALLPEVENVCPSDLDVCFGGTCCPTSLNCVESGAAVSLCCPGSKLLLTRPLSLPPRSPRFQKNFKLTKF